jgi:ribonucleoside-diphosphate reductase alpha chain
MITDLYTSSSRAKMSEASKALNTYRHTLSDNAKAVLKRRYQAKDANGHTIESSTEMFRRVASTLSQAELSYNQDETTRQIVEDMFFGIMHQLDFLPNSPTLMNAGRELGQLSACFVLPIEDDLDAIFSRVKDAAMIHKSGGGTGFSFSRLRPAGDVVGSTGGIASGPVSFIRAFDTATDVVKQGGTRRGANMAILDVTHPDIIGFIKSKGDKQSLSNFNISVAVTEAFMEKVGPSEYFNLTNPRNGKHVRTSNARDVFDLITQMAWETGDPGLIFIDRINAGNPNPHLGAIESTNPCGEQPLQPYESCNLGSVNLANMLKHTDEGSRVDWEKLSYTVRTGVHMLDNVVDCNQYPLPEIDAMSRKTRRIGLGVMGLADMMVMLGIQYDSEDALTFTDWVLGFVHKEVHLASNALAAQRGTYPAWNGSVYSPHTPMRNSAPTTIAPTGTISIIAGASSGIEPLFALSYMRNVMDNTKLLEVNPYFEAVATEEGFYSTELVEQVAATGTLENTNVPQWAKNVFRTSHDITPEWHIRLQAMAQKHTDNSVSKTINFPASATVDDVANAYQLAYKLGCKGITIYRDGSKAEQVLSVGN